MWSHLGTFRCKKIVKRQDSRPSLPLLRTLRHTKPQNSKKTIRSSRQQVANKGREVRKFNHTCKRSHETHNFGGAVQTSTMSSHLLWHGPRWRILSPAKSQSIRQSYHSPTYGLVIAASKGVRWSHNMYAASSKNSSCIVSPYAASVLSTLQDPNTVIKSVALSAAAAWVVHGVPTSTVQPPSIEHRASAELGCKLRSRFVYASTTPALQATSAIKCSPSLSETEHKCERRMRGSSLQTMKVWSWRGQARLRHIPT
jgi:hypothetical protein